MTTCVSQDSQDIHRDSFDPDFIWGVSTSAFQMEGSPRADGKGPSIWDRFSARKEKIRGGQNADVASDFYNRYKEDLLLMKQMNITNFRLSLSWSRILPLGTGRPNQAGIDFYNRVIDLCLELGIEPWVTLYHWDLPDVLEKKGGWTNREIVDWFGQYVSVCAQGFGDRVKHWMVLNEPLVFCGAGYYLGIHAPGKRGMKHFLPSIHHAVLCQAEGGRIIRKHCPTAQIGTTFSCSYVEAFRPGKRDLRAAQRVDALVNRLFLEPALGMGYPETELKFLKGMDKYMLPGDKTDMQFDFDFIGIQNYTREIVKHSWFVPYLWAINVKAEKRKVPLTQMKWEVYPDALYQMIKKFSTYKQVKKLYITENGAAFPDELIGGEVNDSQRTTYIKDNLNALLKATKETRKVKGYFLWTFTDNFEWAEGFFPRFGLVYIDFKTQKRIVKASGRWFKKFLGNNK